jgi:hypothetical protein
LLSIYIKGIFNVYNKFFFYNLDNLIYSGLSSYTYYSKEFLLSPISLFRH